LCTLIRTFHAGGPRAGIVRFGIIIPAASGGLCSAAGRGNSSGIRE
jgi:hypothetical protein